jgi:hypothetical protein
MSVSDNHSVTSVEIEEAILTLKDLNLSLFVWGPPGIGKSQVVAGVAGKLGAPVIDLRMAQCEPTDIRGIPYYNKDSGLMEWAAPIELPSVELAAKHDYVFLFLDEMNSASPAVQAAAYQLVLDRKCGTYKLPENVVIIAAGNRDGDKGVTFRMPSPLANRFTHFEMKADFTAWQNWAVNAGVHQDVVGFLSAHKGDLYDFDPKSSSRAFATPRSWCKVSDVLNNVPNIKEGTAFNIIAGTVGEGLAAKFQAHRRFAGKMPKAEDILSGKVKDLSVKEVSAMYSLTISMCYELKEMDQNPKTDRKLFNEACDNFFTYMMNNFETELIIMGAKISLKTYKLRIDPPSLKTFDDFHAKYGKYVLDAQQSR